jgi:hypothetical protein
MMENQGSYHHTYKTRTKIPCHNSAIQRKTQHVATIAAGITILAAAAVAVVKV